MSKIKIYARVRAHPLQNWKSRPYKIHLNEEHIQILIEKLDIYNKKKIEAQTFTFDKIFDIDYTNDDIYNELGFALIHNILNERSSVFYLYGQTGSGKSYSLLGDEKTGKLGLLELILLQLGASKINFKYNGLQIYNNRCYDIFTNNKLKECELSDGSINFLNIENKSIDENNLKNENGEKLMNEIGEIISNIKKARYIGVSSANNVSSRSHLIFQILYKNNYIKIVDLAGSERASKGIKNEKKNFRENAEINLGILAIKECIRNINKKKIPYRNSKITKILKETFTNNIYTYVLSTISPLKKDVIDTRDTLKYINEFKKNQKKNNRKLPPIKIQNRDEISKLQMLLNNELNKRQLERTTLLNVINDNIKSLKDLKSNLINI